MPQVQQGQSVSSIAAANGMTIPQFLALNPSFAANSNNGTQGDYQGAEGQIQIGQNYILASTTPPTGGNTGSGTETTPPLVTPSLINAGNYQGEDPALVAARQAAQDYYGSNAGSIINEEQIRSDILKQFQAEIDAQNALYAGKINEARVAGRGRLGSSGAIQARRGLLGSSFGAAETDNVNTQNNEIISLIEQEKAAAIASILNKARNTGTEAIAAKRAAKEAGLTEHLKLLEGEFARKKGVATDLAKSLVALKGVTKWEDIDPTSVDAIAKAAGVSVDSIKRIFNDTKSEQEKTKAADELKRKQDIEDAIAKKGNQVLGAGGILVDPKTGKIIARNPKAATGGGGGKSGIYGQLDYRTANAVLAQANKFAGLDIVKKFNTLQSAKNTIAGVNINSKNPADHQAIIYDFAKALDPESVVREGEYATIKKYAQPLFDKYKGELSNAIAGTGFLSATAIQNIKDTIENRYKANLPQYTNVYNQYKMNINNIAGQDIGDTYLTDYQEGMYVGDNLAEDVPENDSTEIDLSELSPEQLAELQSEGLSD